MEKEILVVIREIKKFLIYLAPKPFLSLVDSVTRELANSDHQNKTPTGKGENPK